MIIVTLISLTNNLETEVVQAAATPFWVPAVLFILILLMLLWGLTRGNVQDENRPDMGNQAMPDHSPDMDAHH